MGIWHQKKNQFSLRTKRIKMNISVFCSLFFSFSFFSLIRNKICWWLKLIPLTFHNLQFLLFRSNSFIHSLVRSFLHLFQICFHHLRRQQHKRFLSARRYLQRTKGHGSRTTNVCVERVFVSSIVVRGKTHPKANISVGDFNKISEWKTKEKKILKTVYVDTSSCRQTTDLSSSLW